MAENYKQAEAKLLETKAKIEDAIALLPTLEQNYRNNLKVQQQLDSVIDELLILKVELLTH